MLIIILTTIIWIFIEIEKELENYVIVLMLAAFITFLIFMPDVIY